MRAALALAALVAVTWLALSYRSERFEQRAFRVAFDPRSTEADYRAALDRVRQARTLQPDGGPKLNEAGLLVVLGRQREGETLLEQVVREQPANLQAWLVLATRASRPALRREARRRVRELRPG